MRGLSIADQQMVEIARALASDSRLIVMDEPTAPLTPNEVATLFKIARRLRDEGRSIVFISHRLEEVRDLCDRVTIFRDGRRIETAAIGELSDAEIIRLMIGREYAEYLHKSGSTIGDVALAVRGLTRSRAPSATSPSTCAAAKSSAWAASSAPAAPMSPEPSSASRPPSAARSRSAGRPAHIAEPSDAIALGLAFVPEDRAVAGIFRTLSVEQNITAAVPDRIAPRGIIRRALEKDAGGRRRSPGYASASPRCASRSASFPAATSRRRSSPAGC